MQIDGQDIPAEALRHYREQIEHADPDLVLEFARRVPAAAKGFRLKSASAPGIRSRIAAMLGQGGELTEDMRILLTLTSRYCAPICSLSEEVALGILPSLRILHGTAAPAGALLDTRSAIRAEARKHMGELAEITIGAELEAYDMVESLVGVIEDALLPPPADDAPPPPDEDEEEDEETRALEQAVVQEIAAQIDLLKQENARLKEELEHAHVRAQRVKALEKKTESAEAQAQEARRTLDQERKSRQNAETEVQKLREQLGTAQEQALRAQAEVESRATRRVDERMESVLNAWLTPLRAADEAAASGRAPAEDLLLRARQAIEKQTAIDRHAGNLAEIRKRRDALRGALDNLTRAASEAVHPAPGTAALCDELKRELTRLESTLHQASPDLGPAAARLLARVNNANATVEEAQTVRRLLGEVEQFDLLTTYERVQIFRAYNRRMALEYGAHGPRVVQAAHWDDPVWQLRQAAANAQQLVLMVDGHNVLHLLPELFSRDFEDDAPRTRAREHLVELARRMFFAHPKCDVRIYFDSPVASERRHGANVREIYSGGGEGEHRADAAIVHGLDACCVTMSAMPRLLVTDDRDLRKAAIERGARIVPVAQFGALLEDLR